MKQRIVSAILGLFVLGFVLFFYETVVFNLAVTLLIVLAIYELFKAAKLTQYKELFALCLAFSILMPFMQTKHLSNQLALICGTYAFLLFLVLLRYHSTLHVEQIGLAFFFALMIPFSFSTLLFIHNRYEMSVSILYLLITLGGAWLTDTGAYFVGCKFGKHKLAPNISPKKTIEGAIGGIICNIICYFVLAILYTSVAKSMFGTVIQINYIALGCLAPLASLAGILGDLSASVIKRQCGIKDFGSIMPGHGGVMDRFDSVLFVAPTVFMYIQYVELFKIVR